MGKESDITHSTLEQITHEAPSALLATGIADFLQGRDPSALLPLLLAYVYIPQNTIDEFVEFTGFFRGNLSKKSQIIISTEAMPSELLQKTIESLIKSPQFAASTQHLSSESGIVLETTIRNTASSLQKISQQPPFPPQVYSEMQRTISSVIDKKRASKQELSSRRRTKQAPNLFPSITLQQQGPHYLSLTLGYDLLK